MKHYSEQGVRPLSQYWARDNRARYEIEYCRHSETKAWVDRCDQSLFLSAAEKKACSGMKLAKRRNEWLSGRLAAKKLIQRMLPARGISAHLSEIEILNRPSREPYVNLISADCAGLEFPISISHTEGLAVCAAVEAGKRIGVDAEKIKSRNPAWLDIAFHENELTNDLKSDDRLQVKHWTMKEAVSKLLGTGLSIDLWDIRLVQKGGDDGSKLELHGGAKDAWEKAGRPAINFETFFPERDCVVSVAR